MHLPHTVAHLKSQGLDHRVDLTDLHTVILNAAKVPSSNRAIIVVSREAADAEVVVVGIQPAGVATKTVGLTTT